MLGKLRLQVFIFHFSFIGMSVKNKTMPLLLQPIVFLSQDIWNQFTPSVTKWNYSAEMYTVSSIKSMISQHISWGLECKVLKYSHLQESKQVSKCITNWEYMNTENVCAYLTAGCRDRMLARKTRKTRERERETIFRTEMVKPSLNQTVKTSQCSNTMRYSKKVPTVGVGYHRRQKPVHKTVRAQIE